MSEKDIMNKKKEPFLCPMAWLATGVSAPGLLRLCCNSDEKSYITGQDGSPIEFLKQNSISEYYNNDFMKNIRLQMKSGEIPAACKRCAEIESHGIDSPRSHYLKKYGDSLDKVISEMSPDGTLTSLTIKYLDFALGGKCNLKCRMCIPEVSTAIARDWNDLGLDFNSDHVTAAARAGNAPVDDKFDSFIRSFLPHLSEIQFTSGEPLLSAHHFFLLETAISCGLSSQISLVYFTNLTHLPAGIEKLWAQFQRVSVFVSLDGTGTLNEYIRYPSKWSKITKNFDFLVQLKNENPHLNVYVNTVFQSYGILGLSDLIRFLIPYRATIPPIPALNYIGHPVFHDPSALPGEIKLLALNRINEVLEEFRQELEPFHQIQSILRVHLDRTISVDRSDLLPQFVAFTHGLDRQRNQNILNVIPEFKSFMNQTLNNIPNEESQFSTFSN
jgi:hypothetical protein